MGQKPKSKIIRKKRDTQKKVSKKAENSRTWKEWVFIVVFIIFILVTLYVFLCSHLTKLQYFEIEGSERVNKNEIIYTIESTLGSSFFTYIKKDNYFIASKKNIINNILKDKRIKNVSIEKKFPQTLIVTIEEYEIIPIWCINDKSDCFIIENEIAKKRVNLTDDIIQLNKTFIITGEDKKNIEEGEMVISNENLEKIKILGEELVYVLDTTIKQPYVIASRGSNEVRFVTDEGWYIAIDLTHDLDEILNIARLFTKNVELPSARNDLEYIDMRFPEKIFYKMKDGVEQIEEDTTDKIKENNIKKSDKKENEDN